MAANHIKSGIVDPFDPEEGRLEGSVQNVRVGNIEDLAKSYAPSLRRFFNRRVVDRTEVDDLVQEVFLRLIHRGNVSDVINIEGYLFQTAANVLRDRFRRRTTRQADRHQSFEPHHESINADTVLSPDRVLQGHEAIGHMNQSLLALPEMTRRIFVLCRIERMPYAEVARLLGVSLSTVNKHLAKAMDDLMERMKDVL